MEDKLRKVFSESLGIQLSAVSDSLAYSKNPEWDSVAHVALIAAIEEAFCQALDFDTTWDGHDLFYALTRRITLPQ